MRPLVAKEAEIMVSIMKYRQPRRLLYIVPPPIQPSAAIMPAINKQQLLWYNSLHHVVPDAA